MPKLLLYYPAVWPVVPSRRAYFEAAGYEMVPYTQALLPAADVLLLVTPVQDLEGNWVSPEGVWKRYLLAHYPALKVIQVGWRNYIQGKNYLDWVHLPEDFTNFVEESLSAQQGWEPVNTYGNDLWKTWELFYEGHGYNGFQSWFLVLRRRIQAALLEYQAPQTSLDEVLNYLNSEVTFDSLAQMNQRWERYRLIFSTDPRTEALERFEHLLRQLDQGWQDCEDLTALKNRLTHLAGITNELNELRSVLYEAI
jgi:hypothetical protein